MGQMDHENQDVQTKSLRLSQILSTLTFKFGSVIVFKSFLLTGSIQSVWMFVWMSDRNALI